MNVPHVPDEARVSVDNLGGQWDGIRLVRLRYGLADDQDIPAGLALAAHSHDLSFDPDTALYFLSRVSVHASKRPGMSRWRKRVYIAMSHNAADPTQYFHLPIGRTVVVGAQLLLDPASRHHIANGGDRQFANLGNAASFDEAVADPRLGDDVARP